MNSQLLNKETMQKLDQILVEAVSKIDDATHLMIAAGDTPNESNEAFVLRHQILAKIRVAGKSLVDLIEDVDGVLGVDNEQCMDDGHEWREVSVDVENGSSLLVCQQCGCAERAYF